LSGRWQLTFLHIETAYLIVVCYTLTNIPRVDFTKISFRSLPFGIGRGQAGADEGDVTAVQQAVHVGDDCEKHLIGNVNDTIRFYKDYLIIYRS
jgi:hypothetical protein